MKISTRIKQLNDDTAVFSIQHFQKLWLDDYIGKELTMTISGKADRSTQQNALMWALIHDIDKEMNGFSSKDGEESLYISLIEEANIKPEYMMMLPEAVERFAKTSGFRIVQEVDKRKYNGKEMAVVKCYPGSSKFDTAEMSDLIEAVLRYADEAGVNLREYEELRCTKSSDIKS